MLASLTTPKVFIKYARDAFQSRAKSKPSQKETDVFPSKESAVSDVPAVSSFTINASVPCPSGLQKTLSFYENDIPPGTEKIPVGDKSIVRKLQNLLIFDCRKTSRKLSC